MHLYLIYRIKQKITLNLWYLTQRPKFDLKEVVLETPGPGGLGTGEIAVPVFNALPFPGTHFLES